MLNIYLLVLIIGQTFSHVSEKHQNSGRYVIQEEFNNLNDWENFTFSGNKEPTLYSIQNDSDISYLSIISNASASGIINKKEFDPNQYPNMTWRWWINNLIDDADGKIKSGDDYPIRIFVMFDDDSAETSFWTSILNSAVNLLYGTKPPESSLCFVWSNIEYDQEYFDNPFSETVKMIPVMMGEEGIREWRSCTINIVQYFNRIFNRSCPSSAKIAIMGDTDNTQSRTKAELDYIRIYAD